MKREILEYLICPACLPEENPLSLGNCESSGGDILEGALHCGRCGQAYPIRRGVACLKDAGAGRRAQGGQNSIVQQTASVYESSELLSAYLWSHYADLFEDPEANAAYPEWAALISPSSGAALDAGCAVGRLCFEMSLKCDFAVGVDLSENFIYTARRIMEERKLSFRLKEEGCIHSERSFILPDKWDSKKVEFLVADAGALPFRSESFACVASLNLIDKISCPLEHLREADRSARAGKAQMLISDPFSWSRETCIPLRWLGGAPGGRFAGFGIDNLEELLSGKGAVLPQSPSFLLMEKGGGGEESAGVGSIWKIAGKGSVWWKIRNHRNHFELIRSLFIKAER